MKYIIAIGDIHIQKNNIGEIEELFNETIKYVKKNKEEIKFVVLLGDVLHTFERTNQQPFDRACNFIISLSKYTKVFVIIGNHDRPNKNIFLTDEHFFNPLKKTKNIVIVDDVNIYEDDEGNMFGFVPYVFPGRFQEALDKYKEGDEDCYVDNCKVLFCHQEFKGCIMGPIKSDMGDEWDITDTPIISGHIHEFHFPQKNIFYVPTPIQHSFTDATEKFIAKISFDKENKLENKFIRNITYEKLYMNVKRKRQLTMSFDEYKEYEESDEFVDGSEFITKIIIEGDSKVIRDYISKNKKIKEDGSLFIEVKDNIRKESSKIVDKLKQGNKIMNFKERLKELIDNLDEELKQEFNKIMET